MSAANAKPLFLLDPRLRGDDEGLSKCHPGLRGIILCISLLVLLAPLATHAESGDLYLGGGPAFSFLDPETSGTSFSVDDDTDIGGKVFLGYDFTDRWSLEGFFGIPGEAGLAPSGTIEYDSLGGLGAVFSWPHNSEGLSGFLKGGGAVLDTNSSDVPFRQEDDFYGFGGAGLRYGFSKGWDARLEYEYFFEDLQMITLSVVKRFGLGKKAAAGPAAAAAQAQPEPTPPPEPEVVDSDGDGVPDDRDACANTPAGKSVNSSGCVEFEGALPKVLFAARSSELTAEAAAILASVVEALQTHPTLRITVEGHTCNVGTQAYNQRLSERRARAIKTYLVSKGIAPARIGTRGFGESRPAASNDTAAGRAQNRRCEITIIDQ